MRKTFLIILLICFSAIHFFAQTSCTLFEDYNTSVGWVYEDTDATGATVTTPRISIAGSSLNFINSIDGLSVTRLYKPLGFTLCNNWVAEFKFTPSSINTTHFRSTGHHLFTVTGGPLASLYSAPPLAFTNQDALGITFVSLTSTYDLNIIPLVKDGTNRTIVASCNIALDGAATIGQTYFIRMERLNSTQCRISVFRNSTMQLVGTCCFNIPSSIQNLTHLQHSNFTGGQVTRTLSGSLDSLCIKNCYSLNNVDLGNDTTICGGSYILDAGNPGSTYLWNNGSTIQTLNVTSPGTYSVQVTIGGCDYYDTIIIKCDSIIDTLPVINGCESQLVLPNVFSPNGDNINDVFKPIIDSCNFLNRFVVYNRWGQIIFESTNKISWDGKNQNGKQLSEGVYFYIIEYLDNNRDPKFLKGNVTIFS